MVSVWLAGLYETTLARKSSSCFCSSNCQIAVPTVDVYISVRSRLPVLGITPYIPWKQIRFAHLQPWYAASVFIISYTPWEQIPFAHLLPWPAASVFIIPYTPWEQIRFAHLLPWPVASDWGLLVPLAVFGWIDYKNSNWFTIYNLFIRMHIPFPLY